MKSGGDFDNRREFARQLDLRRIIGAQKAPFRSNVMVGKGEVVHHAGSTRSCCGAGWGELHVSDEAFRRPRRGRGGCRLWRVGWLARSAESSRLGHEGEGPFGQTGIAFELQ